MPEAGRPSSIPSTTSPQSLPSNALLAPTTLLISPSFIGTNKHERRPSLAPSAESTRSWERVSGIYDDYRYSRLASKMSTSSRFSVNAASGITPTSLVPESRPHVDLSGSRQQVDWVRSRRHSSHPLLQVLDGGSLFRDQLTIVTADRNTYL